MSHSLKQTSFPTVGREQNERKEGKVCSAVLHLHHTCKIELGHKYMTLLRKLERMSCTMKEQRIGCFDRLIHSDNCCVFIWYQDVFSGLKRRSLMPKSGVANANHIPHEHFPYKRQ